MSLFKKAPKSTEKYMQMKAEIHDHYHPQKPNGGMHVYWNPLSPSELFNLLI